MGHFSGPVTEKEHENEELIAAKAKLGFILFCVYALIYAGFVLINTLKPSLMEKVIIFELNLAVTYGFGLIILAIVMGTIYNHICTGIEEKYKANEKKVRSKKNDL